MDDPLNSEKVDIASEFNLLPSIFDIINSVQKTSDTQEMAKKVNSFKAKLQRCRELLDTQTGLDMTCEEQKTLLEKHKKEYEYKRNAGNDTVRANFVLDNLLECKNVQPQW